MSFNLDRVLPNSSEAECSVLGACLLDAENVGALAILQLSANDFYYAAHQTIFRAIAAMIEARVPVDNVSMAQYLKDHNQLEGAGGDVFIADLILKVPTTANVLYYIGVVREKALLRNCIEIGHNMITGAFEPMDNVFDWVADHAEKLDVIRNECKTRPGALKAEVHHLDVEQAIADRIAKRSTGLDIGYASLDNLLCGLKPQSLTIIAARPSTGKTALAMNLTAHLARKDVGVLIFSLEQSARQLLLRLVASESRQNLYGITDHAALGRAVDIIHSWPVWIDERGGIKTGAIASEARRICRCNNIGLVIIDRLELIQSPSPKMGLFESTSINSGLVKDIAKELALPVILVCQLNRKSEAEQRLARLHDLRNSGAIEENATSVILLNDDLKYDDLPEYTKDAFSEKAKLDDLVLVQVAKNQDGPTGDVLLQFHREYTRFDSITLRERE